MRGQPWLAFLIVIAGAALGIGIAGLPTTAKDRPLAARAAATTTAAASTTQPAASTTVATTTTTTLAPSRPPTEVRVRAANASTLGLAATNMTTRIRALGYQTLAPADARRNDLAATEVVYTAGFENEARVLASSLGATQVSAGNTTLTCIGTCTGDIIVYVGRDLAT